jgi:hypothetical protein
MQHVKASVGGVKCTLDVQVNEILPSTATSDCHGSANGIHAANVRGSCLDHAEMCVGPCMRQHGKGICGHLN